MRHYNSVFHGLLKHIPWAVFDRLVKKHWTDRRVRELDTKSQFLAMLFGQLSDATSLREIEAGLESHAGRLYHLGAAVRRARRFRTPTRSGHGRCLPNCFRTWPRPPAARRGGIWPTRSACSTPPRSN